MEGTAAPGPIDSHCHLQLLGGDERRRALDEARAAGVRGFLVPALTLADADELLELAGREPDVWCALGVHPHEAASWRPGDGAALRSLVDEEKVVAVGECGLDFHYDRAPRQAQLAAMRAQWEVAVEAGLPVIVHNRDSNAEMESALAEPGFDALTGVLHSYAGGPRLAAAAVGRGFYLGVSGMVTFPRAENVREVLPRVPGRRLLVETDTPYLAPVPHRGRPNRPRWVVLVAERLARELGLDYPSLCDLLAANFRALFTRAGGAEDPS